MRADKIPRDTLGCPLPPPVPSGMVDRSARGSWEWYWRTSPDGTLLSRQWAPYAPAPECGFDPRVHGYCLINGALHYKHPNGVTYRATGVDRFPVTE